MNCKKHYSILSRAATMLLVALLSSMTTWAQDPQIFAGFTATDGTENTSTETPNPEGYAKLVDGKYTSGNYTKWGTSIMSTPPGESGDYYWVDFHSDSPIVVASYILTTGNDNASYKGRNPKSWILKAKLNENDSWKTIATVTNDETMGDVNFTNYEFALDRPGTYQYFRFMVSETRSADFMQLCELRFREPKDPTQLSNATISGLQRSYLCTGDAINISYTVTASDGTELNSTDHYDAVITKGGSVVNEVKDFGTYTLTITAKSNSGYTGEKSATFMVNYEHQIGTGTNGIPRLPTYSTYNYALTQQIYTREEINASGMITSIAFKNIGSEKTRNIDIYLVSTNKSSFSDNTDWISVTNDDMVFSGEVTFINGDWTTIPLSAPFAYDNIDNLAVIVDDNTNSWSSGLNCLSYPGTGQAIYTYNDDTNFDPNTPPSGQGTLGNEKNQIILDITPATGQIYFRPTNLTLDEATANTATLSWTASEGDVKGYAYQYKPTSEETWSTEATVNTTSVTLEGLAQATAYNFRVKAVYADGESGYAITNFFTDCGIITSFPWTEDFEAYSYGDFVNPCWVNEHIEGDGTKIFFINTSTLGTNESHQLQLPDQTDGTKTKLMLPLMDLPADNYQFVLDVYRNNNYPGKTEEGIRVFVSTDGEIEGATELAFIPRVFSVGNMVIPAESEAGWYTYELPIGVSGPCYIILRGDSQYGSSTYMDNFIVREGPSCIMPFIAVNNVADVKATLSWSAGSGIYNVQYKEADAEEWTNVLTETEETSVILTNLTPVTEYIARVQSVCSADDTSAWREVNFKTLLSVEDVSDGWSDDFEGATCNWDFVNGELTNAWTWGSAVNNGGDKALYISNDGGTTHGYANNSGTMVYAFKPLYFDEGKYEFSYDWQAQGESSYDYLRVALVPSTMELSAGTNPPSNFSSSSLPTGWIALDGGSKLNLSAEWQTKTVPVKVDGIYYLVFGWRNDTSGGNQPPAAIDNVNIRRFACAFDAEDLDVNDITSTTATLIWTGEASQWQVVYGTDVNFENASEVMVDEPTCFLTDLSPNSHYFVKVRSYCGGDEFGSWSDVLQFNTDCVIVTEYPWSENFDSYAVDNSSQTMPVCWNTINSSTSNASYPSIKSNGSGISANSAPNCLYLYSSSSFFSTDPQPQYAVLPPMENLQGKQLMLQAKGYNSASTFKIGMMTDPNDVSTFTEIATQTLTTSYQRFGYMLTGEGNYVAIMIEAASSDRSVNCVYIDDIIITDCPSPTDLTLTDLTSTSATLTWTENGTATAWQICLNDGSGETLIDVTEKPYTIENLIAETTYTAMVRAVYDDNEMSEWSNTLFFEPSEKWSIGSGTATNNYLPFSNYYKYSLTEQIYTVAEMGEAGLIESIDFFKNNTVECIRDLDIYMVYTDKEGFEDKKDWISVTADDLVFSGNVTFADNRWTTITLDVPFIYNGEQNVAIIIKDHTGSYKSTTPFLAFEAAGQAIRAYKDNDTGLDPNNPTDNGTIENTKNYIRILKSPLGSCMKPTNVKVTEIGPDCATLSWAENGEATAWLIDYNGTIIEVTMNPCTLTGLTPETEYSVKVCPICDENLWSSVITFTTTVDNPVPTDLAVNNLTPTTATLSWRGYGNSYNVRYKENLTFTEDFEDEAAFNNNWTFISMNTKNTSGTNAAGIHENAARSGATGFRFSSYVNCDDYNQYLISPMLTVSGTLEFYYQAYKNNNTELFRVGYSTTTNDLESFTWSDEIAAENTSWESYTMEIPEDVKYIAINYYSNCKYFLHIDDLSIIPEIDVDWTMLENISGKTTEITGLTAGTNYMYQVQSIKGDNISDWSDSVLFTTVEASDVATGVGDASRLNDNGQMINDNDGWYSLDGRKLNAQPKARGVYIHHGQKVVIK